MNKIGTRDYRSPNFERVDENPKLEAEKLLSDIDWEGKLPIDLLAICSQCDYEVRFEPRSDLPTIPGKVQHVGVGDFYILINTHDTDNPNGFSSNDSLRRRQRFTLAHEISHCTFKSHTDLGLQVDLHDKNNPHRVSYAKKQESQANEFACHLLIPEKAYRPIEKKTGWKNVNTLVNEVVTNFDVSRQTAIQQMARLAQFPAIAILFKSDGMPLRVPVYSSDYSDIGGLFFGKDQPVPDNTAAANLLDGKFNDNFMSKTFRSLDPWFNNLPDWKNEKYGIKETSIQLGQHGVATFLEIIDQE